MDVIGLGIACSEVDIVRKGTLNLLVQPTSVCVARASSGRQYLSFHLVASVMPHIPTIHGYTCDLSPLSKLIREYHALAHPN
jgi:hypothetical protein